MVPMGLGPFSRLVPSGEPLSSQENGPQQQINGPPQDDEQTAAGELDSPFREGICWMGVLIMAEPLSHLLIMNADARARLRERIRQEREVLKRRHLMVLLASRLLRSRRQSVQRIDRSDLFDQDSRNTLRLAHNLLQFHAG